MFTFGSTGAAAGSLTSLGRSPENSSYKGYGLAVMVNILGSCLPGGDPDHRPDAHQKPHGNKIGSAQPVMVAGDPQWNNAAKRMREGIPVGTGLLNQMRQMAQACAAPWLLD